MRTLAQIYHDINKEEEEMRTNKMKQMAEDYLGEYDATMLYELLDDIKDYLIGFTADDVDATEVYELVEDWEAKRPEQYDWALDQVNNAIEDIADQKYQQMKDER